jgi:nitroreductase
MTTTETIESRRSIKHFDPAHRMTAAELAELIRLTKLAPSSFNMQNYRLVAVQDQDLKNEIRAGAWDQAQVSDASVVFVMCADLNAHNVDPKLIWGHAPQAVQDILGPMTAPFYNGNERLIRDEGVRSSALAGMTLMLAAHAMGYDSCPMIGFDADVVGKLINLPADHMVSFLIPVGKKTQEAWDRGPRLSDEKVVIHDRFPG